MQFTVVFLSPFVNYILYNPPLPLKDVLFVDSGDPWNPQPETVSNVKAMLNGVHRVLKPDGIFISISFGQVKTT